MFLDPLRNFYKIYLNLTAMSLLNLNHFQVTQAELSLKAHL